MFRKIFGIINSISSIVVKLFILILIIQIDFLGFFHFKDIPYLIQFNSVKVSVSSIYTNLFHFGIDYRFIIYTILIKLFIFIGVGLIIPYKNVKSRNANLAIACLVVIVYETVRCFFRVSALGVDVLIIGIIGVSTGLIIRKKAFYNDNGNKSVVLVMMVVTLLTIVRYKNINYLSFSDVSTSIKNKWLFDEKNVDLERDFVGGGYKPYLKYLDDAKDSQNRVVEGIFEGISVRNDRVVILISGKKYEYTINESTTFVNKQELDNDNNMIYLHHIIPGNILEKDLSVREMCKSTERLVQMINSKSKVVVVSKKDNILEIYIESKLYGSGVKIL